MSSHENETKSPLSDACNSVLAQWEMYALSSDSASAQVHDSEGDYVVTVSLGIHPSDLLALLRHGRRMLALGQKSGAEGVKASLRAMIGAAPIEPLG